MKFIVRLYESTVNTVYWLWGVRPEEVRQEEVRSEEQGPDYNNQVIGSWILIEEKEENDDQDRIDGLSQLSDSLDNLSSSIKTFIEGHRAIETRILGLAEAGLKDGAIDYIGICNEMCKLPLQHQRCFSSEFWKQLAAKAEADYRSRQDESESTIVSLFYLIIFSRAARNPHSSLIEELDRLATTDLLAVKLREVLNQKD